MDSQFSTMKEDHAKAELKHNFGTVDDRPNIVDQGEMHLIANGNTY